MTTNHRIRQLFDQVIQMDIQDQVRFLDENCGDDKKLRSEVEALMSAHGAAGSFFSHPIVEQASELGDTVDGSSLEGQLVGRYRLDERIDEGGFGEVYSATQTEPVSRRVAVKLIKPGLIESAEAMNRFRAEQQALAILEHPGISRVLDAGEYLSQPYFVMDFVDGQSLVDHCDEVRLKIVERVKLIREICLAVQHAHTKGVVHRDLKPSNILVTRVNGKDVPVVIDFGVAKLMSMSGEGVQQTRDQQLVGTPAYASPEQFRDSRNVDTRSDVYSIGIILYELLSGTTPLQAAHSGANLSIEEIRHLVCEVEPPLPSVQVGAALSTASTVAENRGCVQLSTLSRAIRNELDWIVAKAIEKDPNLRYQTMASFVDDLNCYLSGTPVSAHPQTMFYRSRKFVRKHWVAFSSSFLATATIIVLGSLGFHKTIQASRAEVEKANAETDAANAKLEATKAENYADAVNESLVAILSSPNDQIDGRTVTIAQRLAEARGRVEALYPDDREQQGKFLQVLGETYLGLYLPNEARATFKQALSKGRPSDSMTTKGVPLSLEMVRADVLAGDTPSALTRLKDVIPKLAKEQGIDHQWHIRALLLRAKCHTLIGGYEDAIRSLEPTIEKLGTEPAAAKLKAELAGVLSTLNRSGESIRILKEIDVSALDDPVDQIAVLNDLALAYTTSGQFQEGNEVAEDSWKIANKNLAPNDTMRFDVMQSLAMSRLKVRKVEEALELARLMLSERIKYFGNSNLSVMRDRIFLAHMSNQCQKHDEAVDLMSLQLKELDADSQLEEGTRSILTVNSKMALAAATFDRGMTRKRESDPNAESAISDGLKLQRETIEFAKKIGGQSGVTKEVAERLVVQNVGFLSFLAGRADRMDIQIQCFEEMNQVVPDPLKPIEIPLNNIRIATLEAKQNVAVDTVIARFSDAFDRLKKTGELKGRTLFVIEYCDHTFQKAKEYLAKVNDLESLEIAEKWLQTGLNAREAMVAVDYMHQEFYVVLNQAYLAETRFRKGKLLPDDEAEFLRGKSEKEFSNAVSKLIGSSELFRRQHGGNFPKEIKQVLSLSGGWIETWKSGDDETTQRMLAQLEELAVAENHSR